MKIFRSRYILFKVSGNAYDHEILFHIKSILLPHEIKIVFKKLPFIIVRIDHKSWEVFKRLYGPKITITSKKFIITSIITSGTIKKLKERIKT
ncbi:MAG: hypothetical protein NO475_01290 [Candidatus Methanomethylicia archaeon]|jgi:hypothetical protein|uniref:Uncharacterized protein n=1 Tax=Thermoproteota archaeon TaxID=2056631 RepID=A0A523BHP4_9CREN|nr:hypothetical protein [Candidatus Methanomethylicia archaeon]NHV45663.1 hypothetical protein [Candidatus Verstraetearchaeota archaeon]TDA40453.1 MAG: hypothetical protein DSO09_00520 [Candidatus Verstraetearchaeota archaeon]